MLIKHNDPAEINKVTQRVNTTKNDLNGNDKLAEAKEMLIQPLMV